MILFPVYDLIVKFNMYTLMYEHTLLFFFLYYFILVYECINKPILLYLQHYLTQFITNRLYVFILL